MGVAATYTETCLSQIARFVYKRGGHNATTNATVSNAHKEIQISRKTDTYGTKAQNRKLQEQPTIQEYNSLEQHSSKYKENRNYNI